MPHEGKQLWIKLYHNARCFLYICTILPLCTHKIIFLKGNTWRIFYKFKDGLQRYCRCPPPLFHSQRGYTQFKTVKFVSIIFTKCLLRKSILRNNFFFSETLWSLSPKALSIVIENSKSLLHNQIYDSTVPIISIHVH